MAEESADDPLGDVRSFLVQKAEAAGPTKPKSLKDTIASLMPQLDDLKARGFTDASIANLLKEKKISISAGTLKNYMSAARSNAPKKRVTMPASKPKLNVTSPQPAAPVPAPQVTGRTDSPAAEGSKEPKSRNFNREL